MSIMSNSNFNTYNKYNKYSKYNRYNKYNKYNISPVMSNKYSTLAKNTTDSIQEVKEENTKWTIIKKDKLTNKISITEPQDVRNKKAYYEIQETKKKNMVSISKLTNHWNNYRDTENALQGDTSPYINYNSELKRLIDEEKYIEERILEKHNRLCSDDSDYSDDEANKHLLY